MNNTTKLLIGTLTLGALTTSCQKDYYLDDLNEANATIAQLESISKAKQDKINQLQLQIQEDNNQIGNLQSSLSDALSIIETLNLEIDGLNQQITDQLEIIAAIEADLASTTDALIALQNQSEVDQAEIDNLNQEITDLEVELENAITPEVITIFEQVLVPFEVEVPANQARIIELEMIISELSETIDAMSNDEDVVALTPIATPVGRTGLWFKADNYPNGILQVYTRMNQARYAAFDDNVDFLIIQDANGDDRSLERALYALSTIN